jgi:hypothetical protein
MHPVSLVMSALALGMSAVAKDVGGQMVKDAYAALKRLITDRYKRGGAIAALEEDPSSEAQKKALEEALSKAGVDRDHEVVGKAKELSAALASAPRADLVAIGLHVGELEAINAHFADIEVSGAGTGVDIGKAKVLGDFAVQGVKVKSPN